MNPRFEPKHILAIDFDLTICMSDYPALGPIRDEAKVAITKLYNEGFGIVINTCREGHALSDAMHWLKENDIPYHYVNCNFPHLIEHYKADCRKISADMYIDDKGVEPLPSWETIYNIIHKKFINNEK
jgi:hydroxymethylpyrimidine pyrophosphatase-like HAD family hydrolase